MMNFEENKFDIIDLYINGKLNAADLLEFEKKMKVDATLKEDVAIQKALNNSLADPHYQKFKALNEKVANEYFESDTTGHPKPASNWIKYAVGIAATALIFIVDYQFIANEPPVEKTQESKTPFAQEIYQNLANEKIGSTMGADESIPQLYDNGKFQKFIDEIKGLNEDDASDFQMLLGKAYLQLNQFDMAIQTFDNIIKESRPTIKEKAKMYKAFAYFQSGQTDKGKSLLNEINLELIFSENDKKLINDLKNSK